MAVQEKGSKVEHNLLHQILKTWCAEKKAVVCKKRVEKKSWSHPHLIPLSSGKISKMKTDKIRHIHIKTRKCCKKTKKSLIYISRRHTSLIEYLNHSQVTGLPPKSSPFKGWHGWIMARTAVVYHIVYTFVSLSFKNTLYFQ